MHQMTTTKPHNVQAGTLGVAILKPDPNSVTTNPGQFGWYVAGILKGYTFADLAEFKFALMKALRS